MLHLVQWCCAYLEPARHLAGEDELADLVGQQQLLTHAVAVHLLPQVGLLCLQPNHQQTSGQEELYNSTLGDGSKR
jgi:hypothetical protein